MKKLFISQAMAGLSDDEIFLKRAKLIQVAKMKLHEEVQVIDSYVKDDPNPDQNAGVYYMGHSLISMSQADVVIMQKNWGNYRGCAIEYACAVAYGIPVIFE